MLRKTMTTLGKAMTALVIGVAVLGTAKAQASSALRASVTIETTTLQIGGKRHNHRHVQRGHHHDRRFQRGRHHRPKAFAGHGRADWTGTWTRKRISEWHRNWLNDLDGRSVHKRDRNFGNRWEGKWAGKRISEWHRNRPDDLDGRSVHKRDRKFGNRWAGKWAGKRAAKWGTRHAGKRVFKGPVIVRPARAFHHRFRAPRPLIRHNFTRRLHW